MSRQRPDSKEEVEVEQVDDVGPPFVILIMTPVAKQACLTTVCSHFLTSPVTFLKFQTDYTHDAVKQFGLFVHVL